MPLPTFAKAIRKEEPLLITWEDAIASVDVIEAAYQSLREAPWTGVAGRAVTDLTRTPKPIAQSAAPLNTEAAHA